MIVDGIHVSDTERLRLLREEETALDAEAEKVLDDPLSRYIDVRDNGRFFQSKRLTTSMLKEMSQIERRLLRDWIDAQVKEFESKSALISRHLNDAEPDVPDCWRKSGAA